MRKVNNKLQAMKKLVEVEKFYPMTEAIELAKKTSYSKFVGSIDLAFNLNLDVRQADQQLRGAIVLPHGTGKKIRVLVATDDPTLQESAKKVQADIVVGATDLTELVQKGKFEFDIMVADPKMMPILGRFGKILGPKGLMPNPKTGTVTNQIAEAVSQIKKGKANYRTDKQGIVHTMIGKTSMDTGKLVENAQVVFQTIKKLKPTAVKGTYIKNLTVAATMGPSVKILIEK